MDRTPEVEQVLRIVRQHFRGDDWILRGAPLVGAIVAARRRGRTRRALKDPEHRTLGSGEDQSAELEAATSAGIDRRTKSRSKPVLSPARVFTVSDLTRNLSLPTTLRELRPDARTEPREFCIGRIGGRPKSELGKGLLALERTRLTACGKREEQERNREN